MFSIVIPTFNNYEYLKLCINSIKKNSKYDHEIIIHINEGKDGTLDFLKTQKYKTTYSAENKGVCVAFNEAAKKSSKDHLVLAHDDMYFCPNWDDFLVKEIKLLNHDNFYLSGTMIEANSGHIVYNFGETINNFREDELLSKYKDMQRRWHIGLVYGIVGYYFLSITVFKNNEQTTPIN